MNKIAKTVQEVLKTEFSNDFVDKMKNRMVQSYYKYGAVKDNAPKHDAIAALEKRLALYKETGNTEWLVDVSNFAMIEYMAPNHPAAHFRATSSDESPGLIGKR